MKLALPKADPPRGLRLLPLSLLAAMVAIALGIEAVRIGDGLGVQWAVKLPLIVVLGIAFLARRSRPDSVSSD